MKVSLSWLRTYIDIKMDVDQLAHALTMAGLEVDAVYDRYDFLDSVIVGRITAVAPHPKADKLKCCGVEAGQKNYNVVCGATNAQVGMLAPLALPGTELPDGTILKDSTIRGKQSEAILCSPSELGLGPETSGLMVLDSSFEPGTALNQALALSDMVLDIDLTPNRPDCLNIIGIAREVAAIQGNTINYPKIQLPEGDGDIKALTSVTIDAPDYCPRYAARLVTDIKVGPSPFWLQDRLLSVGHRPINNIVDITNFVMLETGQPLHAFDLDLLAENRIIVKTAVDGEKFTTLDEKERELDSETLTICDGEKPVGLGGVMGGMNSEISQNSTRVLIEGAYFNSIGVRKTVKRLGLNTDASHRFERGVDPHNTLHAIDRAAQLMVDMGKGKLVKGTIDVQYDLPQSPTIDLKTSATNRVLGTNLDQNQIAGLLNSVAFDTRLKDDDTISVKIPSFRVDVSRPEDLMEEVARRWGYDNIPTTIPTITAEAVPFSKVQTHRQRICNLLVGLGFSEAVNYSFIAKNSCDRLQLDNNDSRRRVVELLNPLSEDLSILRSSLIPGLLETMQRNISKQSNNLKIFEIGKTFISNGKKNRPQETEMLAGLWTGHRTISGWHAKAVACDFYDLKGCLESLFEGLRISKTHFTRLSDDQCAYTRKGVSAQILIKDQPVGIIGEIHPKVLEAYGLKQTTYIFEIGLAELLDHVSDIVYAHTLPKFPATYRDATLIINQEIEADKILSVVRQLDEPLVEDIHLFDVFQGKPVPEDQKSISFRITYRSEEKTLEDDIINQIHKELIKSLVSKFKADLPA